MSYDRSAALYDLVYTAMKDYPGEAETIHAWIEQRRPGARSLLDVACGTGLHLARLKEWYRVEGIDLSEGMLAIAQERNPDVTFHRADMRDFDLGERFDVVTCMFSAIGHAADTRELDACLSAFARHLAPGGLCIVEPWVRPEDWIDGYVDADSASSDGRSVARIGRSRRSGRRARLFLHYMEGTAAGVRYFDETLEVTLFTDAEYRHAFAQAGFSSIERAEPGFMGRGMWFGLLPG